MNRQRELKDLRNLYVRVTVIEAWIHQDSNGEPCACGNCGSVLWFENIWESCTRGKRFLSANCKNCGEHSQTKGY